MAKKVTAKKVEQAAVVPCIDHNSRTCIEVGRSDGQVRFLRLDLVSFTVHELPEDEFDRKYMPIKGYDPERACQLYLEYMRKLGASNEALDCLAQHITINDKVRSEIMATTKTRAATAAQTAASTKAAPKKGAAKAKAAPKEKAAPKQRAAKEPGAKRESAAQMFQDLIMDGGMTDDQIFKKVQAKYGLDDTKRSYVAWYRNKLTKDGKKPPAAKE